MIKHWTCIGQNSYNKAVWGLFSNRFDILRNSEILMAIIEPNNERKDIYNYRISWKDIVEEGFVIAPNDKEAREELEVIFVELLEDKIAENRKLISIFRKESEK